MKQKGFFENTAVQISTNGQRHLGAAIGTQELIEAYVSRKVSKWVNEIENLTKMAHTHPHAAFVHGAIGRWLYLMRTIDINSSIFQPLEDMTHLKFVPALTGQVYSSPEVRKLLSLPSRLCGLNIVNPVEIAESQLRTITTPLMKMIIEQSDDVKFRIPQLQVVKSALH